MRRTRSKRLKYETLRTVAHKICKNKRIKTDNCIEKIEENIKEKHVSNAYEETGSLKGERERERERERES